MNYFDGENLDDELRKPRFEEILYVTLMALPSSVVYGLWSPNTNIEIELCFLFTWYLNHM